MYRAGAPLGAILSRRVKGAYGAIELALATDTNHPVRGLRLQRLREPEPVARALQNPDWLQAVKGKGADADWQLGGDIPDVPPEARLSAQVVVDGTRTVLILLATADQGPPLGPAEAPHHH